MPMKVGLFIEIIDPEIYKEADIHSYQSLIEKLMYLTYDIKPNIAFAVQQLSKHNAYTRKRYL